MDLSLVAFDELNQQEARILLILALLELRSTSEIQCLFYSY